MAFDWFTFTAQLINFVLLLVLLRVFLYRPVLSIMDEREKRLSGIWYEAERARDEAQTESERLAHERRELEAGRLARLRAIEDEADELLNRRLAEVEAEAAASRRHHQVIAEESRQQTVEWLRERSARLLVDELRSSLLELADSDLERRTIDVFSTRMRNLDAQQLSELRSAASTRELIVTTAFVLSESERAEVTALVNEILGTRARVQPDFRQGDRLLFGIELTVGAVRVSATGSQRMESLAAEFSRALAQLAAQQDSRVSRATE